MSGKITKKSNKSEVASLAEKIRAKAVENQKKAQEPNQGKELSEEEHIQKKNKKVESNDEEAEDNFTETFESFTDLNLVPELVQACKNLNYSKPTPIQSKAIPAALEGNDIIGLAQTGSGKTAAFAIPILNKLWEDQQPYYACILSPTRELAQQIKETFDSLGSLMGVRSVCVVGGMNMMDQARDLMRKPHIIIATPGRLMDHLENTRGFSLRKLKFLVMDEADRLLDMEFGPVLDKILKILPVQGRTTYLFSATMTSKIDKLQRASLTNPVKCAVSNKYQTVDTLVQTLMVVPGGLKNTFLIYLLNEFIGKTIIIFTRTKANAERISALSNLLEFNATALHGDLNQNQRTGALDLFKAGKRAILVATDVAARGLDIPSVDIVINYDIPVDSKSYIHRVGRTARAGRSGKSISLVSQYDLELILRIEEVLGKKLPKENVDKDIILSLRDSVDKANGEVVMEMNRRNKEKQARGQGSRRGRMMSRDNMDRGER
ncbi:similar to Saccharomyces cerevisiae YHR065C RRP3 Protein involved in rRNA processing [Maudiozyma barnettii]|uniref:ATP-dependent rRNA helicase RRP3 n=1 Tax=Maudiozyma barnettii TaxID=61262 RepID=A0A8H2ZHR2_9SACH|nr:RNA-dependent ATPase RRP3 [Kazachstania barnettii]CAB4252369.1 similar to Saccharomyces cerevisiae YHR065C RRP3 Protein involved in rRNA processing [Kazachstania barnettii]CAD1779103.1 similar to Saccharomyces cerevisiae YHR065C RRP3 Protein involved in rRNA processing [Kazachstania barnettii]